MGFPDPGVSLMVPTVERALPPRGFWSMMTEGERFSILSAFGFSYFGSLPRT